MRKDFSFKSSSASVQVRRNTDDRKRVPLACKRPRVRSPRSAHCFVETWSWKHFYGHFPSSADSRKYKVKSTKFFQLIKRSRSKTESNSACIQVDGLKHFDPDQQRHYFALYFEDLAVPKDQNYDNVFLELCNIRCKETETSYREESATDICVSEAEVGIAIDQLNNEKALDEYGLSSEHFKAANPVIVPTVTKLFNSILLEKKVPANFKTGIITPVLKKGKGSTCMENYRGITVSATFGKLFEYTVLNKMNYEQSDQNSVSQKVYHLIWLHC